MKEKIYTIPVNEAFEQGGECPFCNLHQKLEAEILDYVLGPSYMEEDVREATDAQGFCQAHYQKLFAAQNRLGVALMLHTHLKKINQDLAKLLPADRTAAEEKQGFLQRKERNMQTAGYLEKLESSCYACSRMEGRMQSYVETFFYLWKTEEAFRQKTLESRGFCLLHLKLLFEQGKKLLSPRLFASFLEAVIPLQTENLKRVEEELDWFVQKFDYRYRDAPWKTAKDALPRAILKISGTHV